MPSIEEYQQAQSEMPKYHFMHYSNGRILINWRAVKEEAGRRLRIDVYDLGHTGRSFDNFPRYIVIDTVVKQLEGNEDDNIGLLCTEFEFVTAVKEGLEVFLSNIDEYYLRQPSYYKEMIVKLTKKYLAELNAKLEYLKEYSEYHKRPIRIYRGQYGGLAVSHYFEKTEG